MDYYLLEKKLMREQEFFGLMLINMNKTFDKLGFNQTACVYLNGIDFAFDINQKFYDAVAQLGSSPMTSRPERAISLRSPSVLRKHLPTTKSILQFSARQYISMRRRPSER